MGNVPTSSKKTNLPLYPNHQVLVSKNISYFLCIELLNIIIIIILKNVREDFQERRAGNSVEAHFLRH